MATREKFPGNKPKSSPNLVQLKRDGKCHCVGIMARQKSTTLIGSENHLTTYVTNRVLRSASNYVKEGVWAFVFRETRTRL